MPDNDASSSNLNLIVLHDSPSTDLAHIQAKAWSKKTGTDNFALFDYVKIQQATGEWIGQIIQPNQNISIVGNRLDPTILHGLELMQTHPNVQAVEAVHIFDILILETVEIIMGVAS